MNKETQHTKGTTMLIRQAAQHAATDNECQKIPSYKHDHVYNHSQKCFFVYINDLHVYLFVFYTQLWIRGLGLKCYIHKVHVHSKR